MMKFLRFWFPVIVYFGIIFYASSLPNVKTPRPFDNFDKVIHFFEYLPWGFLVARALTATSTELTRSNIFRIGVFLGLLCGISDEIHQMFVPGREASWLDLMADVAGGAAGSVVYQNMAIFKKRLLSHAGH